MKRAKDRFQDNETDLKRATDAIVRARNRLKIAGRI